MRITAYEVHDFKRIKHVRVEPGETSLVVVGGNNGQGKSSLLDGLTAAFGGKRQTDPEPVRRGADQALITVELEGGLIIRRRIAADGKQVLELYDESGKKRSPQRMLDELVGSRFLDPLAFLRLNAKEQREALIGCVRWPEGFSYGRWKAARDLAYSARRDLHRKANQLEAAAKEALSKRPADVPEAPEVADLMAKLDEFTAERDANAERRSVVEVAEADIKWTEDAIERQRGVIERAQAQLASLERDLVLHKEHRDAHAGDAGRSDDEIISDIADVRAKIGAADSLRDARRDALALVEAADRTKAAADVAHKNWVQADNELDDLDNAYTDAWQAADVPIPDVRWDDDQVLLGEVPFQQASNAEQLRAALAIAMAMSPQIRDIWVKDGSLLDDNALELVRQVAEEKGFRVWLERVGEGDAGALIVREGELVTLLAAAS